MMPLNIKKYKEANFSTTSGKAAIRNIGYYILPCSSLTVFALLHFFDFKYLALIVCDGNKSRK